MRYLIAVPILLVTACATVDTGSRLADQQNLKLEAAYLPTRVKYTALPGGASTFETGIWAGTVGTTAANQRYQEMIFQTFREKCGLEKSALKEVRVVKHEAPVWYEVWVFNNPASGRPDKTSGMAVVMKFDEQTNRTDVSFNGGCKSPQSPTATSS